MHGQAKFSESKHAAMHCARTRKLCSTQNYIGVVFRYAFRSDNKEAPAHIGMTMAYIHIIEEEQKAAQSSDSREMATSSTDRMAQTPPILLFS